MCRELRTTLGAQGSPRFSDHSTKGVRIKAGRITKATDLMTSVATDMTTVTATVFAQARIKRTELASLTDGHQLQGSAVHVPG